MITRGDLREPIFGDTKDREMFLNKLSEYKERHNFIPYDYILYGQPLPFSYRDGERAVIQNNTAFRSWT